MKSKILILYCLFFFCLSDNHYINLIYNSTWTQHNNGDCPCIYDPSTGYTSCNKRIMDYINEPKEMV